MENQSCACDRVSEVSFFVVLHHSENRPLGHGEPLFKGLTDGCVFACLPRNSFAGQEISTHWILAKRSMRHLVHAKSFLTFSSYPKCP